MCCNVHASWLCVVMFMQHFYHALYWDTEHTKNVALKHKKCDTQLGNFVLKIVWRGFGSGLVILTQMLNCHGLQN